MSYASALLRSGVRRLLIFQAAIVLIVGFGMLVSYSRYSALSTLYGGGLAMWMAVLLAWRVQKIGMKSGRSNKWHMYLEALERFLLVTLGIWAGMSWLRLLPLPLIVGFATAQVGYFFRLTERPLF